MTVITRRKISDIAIQSSLSTYLLLIQQGEGTELKSEMKAKTVAKNLTLILHALNSCNIVYKEDKTKQKTKNQNKKIDQDG